MTFLPPLPPQPAGTPWPTEEWPLGNLPTGMDRARFDALVDAPFVHQHGDFGETFAFVAVHKGRLVHERYGPNFGPDVTCPSWSEAKSITQALVGILVGDGKLDIHAPADVREWREATDDPRRAITLDLLLRMSSGLAFIEEYSPDRPSDVVEMLWGKGKDDVAHFAASFPLAHKPGSFYSYASGTTNIVSRCAAQAADAFGPDFERFMRGRLFDPIGMKSPRPKFDKAGTFIGSSFCFSTPRDFARFGLLYMRGGVWDGRRILPPGWVDYARTPTWQQETTPDGPYGAHWWLGLGGPGSFSANGYEGQFTVIAPDIDLILVRNGKAPGTTEKENVRRWLGEIANCFR
ncbi:serine hydrolase [Parvibaculum sp.]|uniref:serine hydrolase domain-containing protein n=1 Tax=Parvibaculum sp. TaxID=2024848 RepID=UPI00321153D6